MNDHKIVIFLICSLFLSMLIYGVAILLECRELRVTMALVIFIQCVVNAIFVLSRNIKRHK